MTFLQADLFALPFAAARFDHVFVCFVLEHLAHPLEALGRLKQVLRPGGTLTVIEGDHGSTSFYPESAAAQEAIACLVVLQQEAGGVPNAERGRAKAEHPRHSDPRRPLRLPGDAGRQTPSRPFRVPRSALPLRQALLRTTAADGVFCYTFFKAVATKR